MPTFSAINSDPDGSDGRPASANSSRMRHRSGRGRKEVGIIGQASLISSVINLLNTILGAGTLAMPLALSRMGVTLGISAMIWSGLTAGFGLYLQTRCARYIERGSASFFALSQITYPNAAVLFDAAIVIKCFGVGVSYLIIIGDLMPGVVQGFSGSAGDLDFLLNRRFWVTGFMLIIIPLSFLRRLDSLKYTSVIALIAIGYLIIFVAAHFLKRDTMHDRGAIRVVQWESAAAALSTFPVIVFAYTCHQNMFSILNEISNNSHLNTTSVVFSSIGIACAVYILVGITGYLSFGDHIQGTIIGMYGESLGSTIGKAAIVILVMFSYPLQVHPCRASVDAILRWRPKPRSDSSNASPSRNALLIAPSKSSTPSRGDGISDTRFAAITTTIIVLSYIVAMTVSSLEKVLAYVGSTGSTSISFILPGLFYYKISSPGSPHHQKLMKEDDDEEEGSDENEDDGLLGVGGGLKSSVWRRNVLRKLSFGLAVYGVVVMVACLITNTFFTVVE